MPSAERIRNNLPSLYRPETHETSELLPRMLDTVGASLDQLREDLNVVLQAHWYDYADRAQYSPYFVRSRELHGLPPLNPLDPADRSSAATNPYLLDLARLGSLMSLPPWREPRALRELVEAYRLRLRRLVNLHRNGLGTLDALRGIVEAFLQPDIDLPLARRDRSFSLEEWVALGGEIQVMRSRGAPDDLLGPMMRWSFENRGHRAATPTIYVQGVAPVANEINATVNPLIELFSSGANLRRIGIAFGGTLNPGQTLRLRPAWHSWLGDDNGLRQAESLPGAAAPADATAPGPWSIVAGAPVNPVTAIMQTHDHHLWLAVDNAGAGELWRHDGQTWTRVLDTTALSRIRCLHEQADRLLVGTEDALLAMDLYPGTGSSFAATALTDLNLTATRAIHAHPTLGLLIGTEGGLFRLNADDTATPLTLQNTQVAALTTHADGTLFAGGELGLFQYQPGPDHWYWYRGESQSDQVPDWVLLDDPTTLPDAGAVFLPAIISIAPGPDESLWLGSANGFARYRARHEGRLAYRTMLEAFPDLSTGAVTQIAIDARGLVWFATERGVFRYDGRDIAQFDTTSEQWLSLGRADQLYPNEIAQLERGVFRFNRNLGTPAWERFDDGAIAWRNPLLALRGSNEEPVRHIAWTGHVAADLGEFDGAEFSAQIPVAPGALRMRFKPSEEFIVDGGLPAIPALEPGVSTWRYLALEPAAFAAPPERPFYSMEGRLFLPPDRAAAYPARFNDADPAQHPESQFDDVVFAYPPAARVWFEWPVNQPLTVLVRLYRRSPGETIEPAILDRVWAGMQRVRPAGVSALLALDQQIVRGVDS